ncbi:MAG: undecaprenyldiphospho-muramoylpentapeptide beta-N-acetylglucosaminyltransferase [Anaerolineaceae bacterium]|nr:undecaprenyldiphospho-muramoylpentapeptide beta-N-acetylglucosaminyltransferase [Anaerolineaceae bacterium]
MRLLICAGGTGGGVYPALTVSQALKIDPENILWVGSMGGMEESLVKRENIPFLAIPAAGVHGVSLKRLPGNIMKLFRGFLASRKILKQFRADILLFTGGFVAIPMALAGLSTCAFLYTPDIEPGLAIKILSRFARKIAVTTENSRKYFPNQEKIIVTGYPIRQDLSKWTKKMGRAYFKITDNRPVILFMGGSSGARSINNAVLNILDKLVDQYNVIHITGHLDWEIVNENTQKFTQSYYAYPYLHEMGAALSAADLVISRAGASTLGEYPLFNLPAILVPYPYAWRYQKVNADYLVDHNAAIMLLDEDLNQTLLPTIENIMNEPEELERMKRAMQALAQPDAAIKIAELIHELVEV